MTTERQFLEMMGVNNIFLALTMLNVCPSKLPELITLNLKKFVYISS